MSECLQCRQAVYLAEQNIVPSTIKISNVVMVPLFSLIKVCNYGMLRSYRIALLISGSQLWDVLESFFRSNSVSLYLSISLSLSLSLSLSHTHTHTHSLSLTHTHTLSLSTFLSLSHTHTLSLSLSTSLSFSLTHTRTALSYQVIYE